MPSSHLPPLLTSAFSALASWLHVRSAARLPLLLGGILLAQGRRTVTSWFRAAAITADYRQAYVTLCATGRKVEQMAVSTLATVRPLQHPDWGTIALPLQAGLYIRQKDLPKLPKGRARPFRTKLQMAAQQLNWLDAWAGHHFAQRWVVVDGAYAKRPFLKPAKQAGFTVISRLRKDAALWSLPKVLPAGQRGPGRPPVYGKQRISLVKRAGQTRGWEQVECVQYGEAVTKTIKTFLATWRPAGGLIRVVLVKEADDWLPYFSAGPALTAVQILEGMADRGALEQTFKDDKEVWGAGQQQVRNVYSNEGCFNLCLWVYSLTEAWAWGKPEEELVDRSQSPWDSQPRRPSHADKRKALRLEVLRGEIEEALAGRPTKEAIRALAERLLALAA